MVSEILGGVTDAIKSAFGDSYRVDADEHISQGLEEPCFFILVLNAARESKLGAVYELSVPLDVHYFSSDTLAQMYDVGSRLLDILECIELRDKGTIRGGGLRFEIIDDVLHFFVTYNLRLIKKSDPDPYMEDITIYANLGGIDNG